MANEAKELFDLSVFELSLVDYPANEEEFIIIKQLNQEDTVMPTNTGETKVEKSAEELAEAQTEESVETSEQAEGEQATEVSAEKSEEETQEVEAPAVNDQLVEQIAKATAEAVSKSLGAFAETFKSMLAPAQEAAAETQEQKATAESAEEVTEEATEVAEVTEPEDVAKSLLGKLDALVNAMTTSQKVEKSEKTSSEVDIVKSVGELKELVTGMDSRLTNIEKMQMPDTAIDSDATDTTVQKSEGSVFKGIL